MSKRIAIIGGGIIGLSLGMKLGQKFKNSKITIFEKESKIGLHQSGRNSGVLHCGLGYRTGTLKAKLAVDGINQMINLYSINLPNKMNKIENELNELNISLHKNLDFLELEKITSQSKVLISCHGAISHVAAAYNIKQIDIIDKTYDYSRWTNHFRNYNYLYRDNFSKLSCRILDLI